jgi:glycosyltransferase involved in cell wall biosynthesis
MSDVPKISIVTPTFNQGQYIQQTIDSILDQKYPNLEYIIIDGGSTDNTVEIIKKYEKYLSFWISEKDNGQSHAINKGLQKCTGDVFNWINSDDYYNGNVFEKVAQAFTEAEVNLFCGCSHIFGGDKEWVSEGTRLPDSINNNWAQPVIDQPATFFRMNIVRDFNGLNNKLHYTMDLEWLLKFWLKYGTGGMKKSQDVLIHFREHPGSKTVNFQEKFVDERLHLYRSIIHAVEGAPSSLGGEFAGIPINISPELIFKTINQFVYFELLEAYSNRDFKRYNDLKDMIRVKCMPEKDRAEFLKMTSRAKLLSKIPKQLLRRVKK